MFQLNHPTIYQLEGSIQKCGDNFQRSFADSLSTGKTNLTIIKDKSQILLQKINLSNIRYPFIPLPRIVNSQSKTQEKSKLSEKEKLQKHKDQFEKSMANYFFLDSLKQSLEHFVEDISKCAVFLSVKSKTIFQQVLTTQQIYEYHIDRACPAIDQIIVKLVLQLKNKIIITALDMSITKQTATSKIKKFQKYYQYFHDKNIQIIRLNGVDYKVELRYFATGLDASKLIPKQITCNNHIHFEIPKQKNGKQTSSCFQSTDSTTLLQKIGHLSVENQIILQPLPTFQKQAYACRRYYDTIVRKIIQQNPQSPQNKQKRRKAKQQLQNIQKRNQQQNSKKQNKIRRFYKTKTRLSDPKIPNLNRRKR